MVCEWYFDDILDSLYRSMILNAWYFKLPLSVPLSPAEISLNGPMVLNDTEWCSIVYHWLFFVRLCACNCVLVVFKAATSTHYRKIVCS